MASNNNVDPCLIPLKISFKGEMHRIRIDLNHFSFDTLKELFETTYSLTKDSFVIQYRDIEGDIIHVSNNADYIEACRQHTTSYSNQMDETIPSLRFIALTKSHAVFQENVSDPILKALEKLIESIQKTIEKVKKEDWSKKYNNSKTATNEIWNQAIQDARESIHLCKENVKEIPFDQMLKETTDGFKVAIEGIGMYAKDFVDELKKVKMNIKQDENQLNNSISENMNNVSSENVSAPIQLSSPRMLPTAIPVVQQEVESDAATDSSDEERNVTTTDSEWEQVNQQNVSSDNLNQTNDLNDEKYQQWKSQLSIIHDFFPECTSEKAVSILEKSQGNIEIVLNLLAEN